MKLWAGLNAHLYIFFRIQAKSRCGIEVFLTGFPIGIFIYDVIDIYLCFSNDLILNNVWNMHILVVNIICI